MTAEPTIQSADGLKEEGNAAVKRGQWSQAIDKYTEALQLMSEDETKLRLDLYRNRSLARLKLDEYEGAEADCTEVLEKDKGDTKALYRRALAREQLEKIGGALLDCREGLRITPHDQALKELFDRLAKANSDLLKKTTSMDHRVNEMHKLVFDGGAKDAEQRATAINNLFVLARDSETGAQRVWNEGRIVPFVLSAITTPDTPDEFVISAVRVLDEVCKNHGRAMKLLSMLNKDDGAKSVQAAVRLMCARPAKEYVDAISLVIQRFFNATCRMDRSKEIKPDPEVAEANKLWIIRLILELQSMLTDKNVTAIVREAAIDLFVKNLMHMDGGIPRGWSWRFVSERGLLALLDVSAQSPEQCDYPVSAETRQHLAICLTRLHDDMVFDTKRTIFKEKLDLYFNNLMSRNNEREFQIRIANVLCTLLQGPVDLGVTLVTNDQITAMMLQMAASEDLALQSVAAELIVLSVVKHERASNILKNGLPILRKLYDSEDANVKVRALVGLCKCASAGGDDLAKSTMQEGASLKLAQTCKKFLLDVNTFPVDVRRFACEGLSYLSLDADVKEWIVEDPLLLKALLILAQSAGALCVYTLAQIYVNLTNSYEKPKVDEEMVKLAQFAKHHVPETHPFDVDQYIEKRVRALVQEGAVAACVAIHKTESKNALELIARAMLAFADCEDLRGKIIAEGGTPLLLHLTKEASGEGKIKAAHAIARLGMKADPDIAFPGQRAYEVVKPLVELLHPDVEGRANYDALVTLTNLASKSDSIRRRIVKERAAPKIEEFWFMVEHVHLRAAAAELLLNLLFLEELAADVAKKGTDKLKLWILYASEAEDERLSRTSAAGFVVLTDEEGVAARIMDEISSWRDCFQEIAMHEDPETQRRGLMAMANLMERDEKMCAEIVACELFRVLVAITKLGEMNAQRKQSMEEAKRCLKAAEDKGFIKASDREMYERTNQMSTVVEE
ncbi:hypothetical protein PMAYCL1PPCAC_04181 [Pristionchus mayeri]|uniref:UNC-45/Cro1/She4 central domain-containing protein n=1 Tax=Pristionchus mayeri TaxID=1317129 RepID=A0AAN4Z7N0_9BILA|nr:hypothetical protein PMAYCL1PPCAC_04181 [Pristionchus mayeri]